MLSILDKVIVVINKHWVTEEIKKSSFEDYVDRTQGHLMQHVRRTSLHLCRPGTRRQLRDPAGAVRLPEWSQIWLYFSLFPLPGQGQGAGSAAQARCPQLIGLAETRFQSQTQRSLAQLSSGLQDNTYTHGCPNPPWGREGYDH